MFHHITTGFLNYCRIVDFSDKSIQALTSRINEFISFLKSKKIRSAKKIAYSHLIDFTADYKSPSIHITKSRVWTLRQFFHFLTLHQKVPENIALKLPYPKIEKTEPWFLTIDEYKRLIRHFSKNMKDPIGLRNLVIILLLGTLGLRTSTLIGIDIDDIDLKSGLIRIKEKGKRSRSLILPKCLCEMIKKHLKVMNRKTGPLLLSKRKKRISQRTLQDIFQKATLETGINKKLHARLFRHTSATHLNQVAGTDVTQHVLGHARRANTHKYAHLNPDLYAEYMKKHPYMKQ